MVFHVITLFPETIEPYLKSSIVGRAKKKGLVKIKYYNPLDFAVGKHRRVDDKPYGGGPGMVMQLEPLLKAFKATKVRAGKTTKVILFSPAGKQFHNKTAAALAKSCKNLILICGRYEGIDERIKKILKDQKFQVEEVSVGPYVLTGGELAAMIFVDVISRQIKGVLGKEESLEESRLGIGVPAYTRPEVFSYRGKKYRVPQVLLSGDHKKIEEWRKMKRKRVISH